MTTTRMAPIPTVQDEQRDAVRARLLQHRARLLADAEQVAATPAALRPVHAALVRAGLWYVDLLLAHV